MKAMAMAGVLWLILNKENQFKFLKGATRAFFIAQNKARS
ncbi:hypothetical protein PPHE_a0890 [Pseudoalteromonas phenolica O-BC30]|nr:hypothetical protein [Pseudoalteromonas phenolica O-BC30]